MTAPTLAEQLTEAEPPVVLDVRTEREWQEKHIEGSLNIPLQHLPERLVEVPTDGPVVVHCATGYRSSIAASLLEPGTRFAICKAARPSLPIRTPPSSVAGRRKKFAI
jgi:rhodanese-related sulfurtransferase